VTLFIGVVGLQWKSKEGTMVNIKMIN